MYKTLSRRTSRKKSVSTCTSEEENNSTIPKFKKSKKPTVLRHVVAHFVVGNVKAKSAVYSYFRLSVNPSFTIGVDPFESIKNYAPTTYICYCNNNLGPADPNSNANFLCLHFGIKQKEIEEVIVNKFGGEIPPNSLISFDIKDDSELLFVILDESTHHSYYHATRIICLYLINKFKNGSTINAFQKFRNLTTPSAPSTSSPNSIPSLGVQTKIDSFSSGTFTRALSLSPRSSDNKSKLHITFSIPEGSKDISQELIIWQISKSYRKFVNHTTILVPPTVLAATNKKLDTPLDNTLELKKKSFCDYVKRIELVRRGILDEQEINWLLDWLTNDSSTPMQLAAATSIIDYIQSNKPTLPIEYSRKQVLDCLFTKEKSLSTILDLAVKNLVSLHKVVDPSEIKKNKLVGEGATSSVYCGNYNNNSVAVKEFTTQTKMEEFRREVAIMSLLRHPCLVNIIGAGTHKDGVVFLVMEYVSKGDLYTILHEKKDINLKDDLVISWAADIACGMQYLHSLGIIHRDLKSLNILITEDNHCKITDYGTSRVISETTMTGKIGTIAWMAPEMFQQTTYTEKVDVYSFGIILFELIVRKAPYDGENSFGIPMQVVKGVRPKLPKNIPKKWIKLLSQCWHERPSKRPSFEKIIDILKNLSQVPFSTQKSVFTSVSNSDSNSQPTLNLTI